MRSGINVSLSSLDKPCVHGHCEQKVFSCSLVPVEGNCNVVAFKDSSVLWGGGNTHIYTVWCISSKHVKNQANVLNKDSPKLYELMLVCI